MMKPNISRTLCVLALSGFGTATQAAVECTETVNQVFNHSNGDIYFATDQTCGAGWCQIKGNSDFIKRGYAMLLAAQLSGKKVSFRWSNISSCAQNPLYESPEFMWTTNL